MVIRQRKWVVRLWDLLSAFAKGVAYGSLLACSETLAAHHIRCGFGDPCRFWWWVAEKVAFCREILGRCVYPKMDPKRYPTVGFIPGWYWGYLFCCFWWGYVVSFGRLTRVVVVQFLPPHFLKVQDFVGGICSLKRLRGLRLRSEALRFGEGKGLYSKAHLDGLVARTGPQQWYFCVLPKRYACTR